FGSDDEVVFVAYKAPNVLGKEMRDYADHLSQRLSEVSGISGVFGIKDAYDFGWSYLEKEPGTSQLKEQLIRKELRSNPLFRGNVISADGRTTSLWLVFSPSVQSEEDRADVLVSVQKILEKEERESGLRFYIAGIPVIEHEYVVLTKRDLLTFLPLAVAVFFLLLCMYFRNVMGTFLPLATVGIAMLWTVGLMSLFGLKISVLSSIVPILILIIGIADSVHLLSRYREDAQKYENKREALAHTMLTMVAACFLTTFTTAIGFVALLTTDLYIVQEFGVLTAVGIMIAYVVAIEFLPSVLDNVPRFRGRIADNFSEELSDRTMNGIARINLRHRGIIFVMVSLVVTVSVVGIFRIKNEGSWLQDIRESNPVYQSHKFFEENLSDVVTLDIILRSPEKGQINDVDRLKKIEAFQREVSSWVMPGNDQVRVTQTLSYTDFLKEVNRARVIKKEYEEASNKVGLQKLAAFAEVRKKVEDGALRRLPADPNEMEACLALYSGTSEVKGIEKEYDLVARMTDEDFSSSRLSVRLQNATSTRIEAFIQFVRQKHKPFVNDFSIMPTGKTWLAKKAMDSVIRNMVASLGLAAVIIFISMSLLFRSIKVGVLAIVPNMLPMVVTGGAMGWLGIPLSFSSVTIFSVALGIAVDTTIHYLARLRLEVAVDHDHTKAMYRALKGAGRPMIFATILLVLGFGSILT
ncbi:MAG: MMPL family transporter, partial [Planctomycetota bacterium]|nr:MMPL family transporter [Planctomycetota bacterium]